MKKKITWQFRLWYLRHRRHLWLRYHDVTFCAKCQIPAPHPYKED